MQLDLQYSVAADGPFLFLIAGSLPFLPLGETPGVAHVFVEPVNDGFSDAIAIPEGFPFGGSIETEAYVSFCSILLCDVQLGSKVQLILFSTYI